ncbi:DUF6541 family protein [Agromyces sp. C10]|uniref:DUF6541 family protein n=1 Tax=Agromyces sp. C10 TaxID=2935077 RepID=UPI00200B3F46|nr:DUF6541 family protein [Agromyces sp. C10]MCK8608658.1 hypothetical protein [Agromyces sp. C10]
MSWIEALPAIAVAIVLFVVPGAPFALLLGLRGVAFLGVAVAASVGIVGAASIAAPLVGLDWGLLPVGILAVVGGLVGFALRRWSRRPSSRDAGGWSELLHAAAGLAAGAALILATLLPGMGSPRNPSQTYDAIFHLNAVRWIADTGDASPFHMTMTTPGASSGFYPTTWHAFAALVMPAAGADPVVAANSLAVVVAAVVWPVACVFLARMLFGPRPLVLALAGALSAGFAAFPYLLAWYGVLYPNSLAIALVPVALGSLVGAVGGSAPRLVGITRRADDARIPPARLDAGASPLAWGVATLVAVVAATLAHPNALFSIFVLSAPLVIAAAVRGVRTATRPSRRVLIVAATLAVFAVEAFIWSRFQTGDNGWPSVRPFYVSLAEALRNSPLDITVGWVVTLLVGIGVVGGLLLRRTPGWLVASWLLAATLFAFANGWPEGPLRTAITGLWYNDAFRLAALGPVVAVPLAVVGLVLALDWAGAGLDRLARRRGAEPSAALRATVLSLVAAIAVVGTQFGAIRSIDGNLADVYRLDADSPSVNPDELALFDDVAELVPEDAVIAGNPWNGSALVYAFTGRQALFPHVGGAYPEAHRAIAEGLADGAPEACAAAAELGVTHVIDSDDRMLFIGDARAELYPGLTDLPRDPAALSLLAERGDARLYEVTGC